ncbi:hypothetical protein BAE44_0017026 [Dichanthelium oligosanthes]|uniref:Uncharacterized protein n=1 Tax=Dichanthelium oligosanthes TaxID=888268 RepID=A0A1E5VAB3_9POAL|nr:hypothetical protein BAE44_0017026 [Dichanthelium oligosanthes]
MEAAAATSPRLTRSASLSVARLTRSPTARFPPSPQLCSLSLPLRRARSDADLASFVRSAVLLHHAPIPAILEADEEEHRQDDDDRSSPAGLHRLLDGAGAGGAGTGQGGSGGNGGRGGGGQGSGCDMDEYYRRVLLLDPENPLLLRNYGKYLHEVEGDLAGAEGCYARALLACPGDADLLSLYGRVIWEARQEKDRAEAYFERAVQAAPDDCYVLGSYASFLWDAEEDDDETAPAANPAAGVAAPASCDSPALVPVC